MRCVRKTAYWVSFYSQPAGDYHSKDRNKPIGRRIGVMKSRGHPPYQELGSDLRCSATVSYCHCLILTTYAVP